MHGPTIIIEMENARQVHWEEVRAILTELTSQIDALSATGRLARPQVVFSQAGSPADTAMLAAGIRAQAPRLAQIADLDCISVPDGRYYELKNEAVKVARGDPVIFLDSDALPGPRWLETILAPFESGETTIVNGYTYLESSDFVSRTFALIWFFPLRHGDGKFAAKRALNLNNSAFRRHVLEETPIPYSNGFKVSCTLLMDRLGRAGHQLLRTNAMVCHPAPKGLRFFLWRALVTGRDADRKYSARQSSARSKRVRHALSRWFTTMWRTTRRVFGNAHKTGMPAWQTPFAWMAGLAFYNLATLAQIAQAAGVTADRVEYVPDYVEHS
ncbi:glycosyltransferase family 2 protein [Mesorhizobium sp. CC13]|uniref:glycosyltransferase family 2 protein n=1 Tax=Mesorhizobium sp. CC13 TaxID=3029194 RepID=UPI00326566EF